MSSVGDEWLLPHTPARGDGPHRLDVVVAGDEIGIVQVDGGAAVRGHQLNQIPWPQILSATAFEGAMLLRELGERLTLRAYHQWHAELVRHGLYARIHDGRTPCTLMTCA